MSIATKNGSIIVKDGSVGTDCGCCGGWYCCPDEACAYEDIVSVTATVSIGELLLQTHQRPGACFLGHIYRSVAVNGISNTFTLSPSENGRRWSKPASNCRDVSIDFEYAAYVVNGVQKYIVGGSADFSELTFTAENDAIYKTVTEMNCFNSVTGEPASYDNVFKRYRADGTRKCSSNSIRTVSASEYVEACGAIPPMIQSGVVNVALGGGCPSPYSFDEQCYTSGVDIISQIGGVPGIWLFISTPASIRFDIALS